jgi:hypothetical protein
MKDVTRGCKKSNNEAFHVIWIATQTLWSQNPKIHHRIQNIPLPAPILSQLNPLHTHPANLPKIYSDPILPLYKELVYCSAQMINNEIGGGCSMRGEEVRNVNKVQSQNLRKRNHVEGSTLINRILRADCMSMEWIKLAQDTVQ